MKPAALLFAAALLLVACTPQVASVEPPNLPGVESLSAQSTLAAAVAQAEQAAIAVAAATEQAHATQWAVALRHTEVAHSNTQQAVVAHSTQQAGEFAYNATATQQAASMAAVATQQQLDHIATRHATQQQTTLLLTWACAIIPALIMGIAAPLVIIRLGTNWANAVGAARVRRINAETKMLEWKARADSVIRTVQGDMYLLSDKGDYIPLPAPTLAENPAYTARREVTVNTAQGSYSLDMDGRPNRLYSPLTLTDYETEMLSMLAASVAAIGGNHPYIAGGRHIRRGWSKRSDARQGLVNSLKRAGLVESSAGPIPSDRLSNIWLVEDGEYQTVEQLITAIRSGLLRLPEPLPPHPVGVR